VDEDESSDGPRMVKRMDNVRDCTVSELIDWCVQRDLSPLDATITSAHVKWESPETDAERERREKWVAEHLARTEKWERETLERLKEKYG
jgi:hypothetical protein